MAKKKSKRAKSKSSKKKSRAKPKVSKKSTAKKSKPMSVSSMSSYEPLEHPFAGLQPTRTKLVVVGMWALILSVLASVMFALIDAPAVSVILVAVGFVVGFLNFEHEEPVKLMVALATLLIVASALLLTGFSRLEIVSPVVAAYLSRAAYNVIAVGAPSAFVIALKALKELAE